MGVIVVAITLATSVLRAQQLTDFPLPVPRVASHPVDVADVGTFPVVRGGDTTVAATPELAVADLRWYDAYLASANPPGVSDTLDDALHALRRARARTWLARLRPNGPRTDVTSLENYIDVAMRAEADSVALRVLDARLATIPTNQSSVVARSAVLAMAIHALTDESFDSARIARHFASAQRYAVNLEALPASGYARTSDSTDVLYRQYTAALAMLHASDVLARAPDVVRYATRAVARWTHLDFDERRVEVGALPYRIIATALAAQPNGRAQLDAFDTTLLSAATLRLADHVHGTVSDEQSAAQALQSRLRGQFASFALLGQPAPPVTAHAWLNTSDSTYAAVPRAHTFADGMARVLAFGPNDGEFLLLIDRLRHRLPADVQVIYVTHTEGNVGPDLATPADEVTWLASYYREKLHLTMPIALWAGEKVAGPYGSSRPARSPNPAAYHAETIGFACVIVDGHGVVRAYADVGTPLQDAALVRRVIAIRAE